MMVSTSIERFVSETGQGHRG